MYCSILICFNSIVIEFFFPLFLLLFFLYSCWKIFISLTLKKENFLFLISQHFYVVIYKAEILYIDETSLEIHVINNLNLKQIFKPFPLNMKPSETPNQTQFSSQGFHSPWKNTKTHFNEFATTIADTLQKTYPDLSGLKTFLGESEEQLIVDQDEQNREQMLSNCLKRLLINFRLDHLQMKWVHNVNLSYSSQPNQTGKGSPEKSMKTFNKGFPQNSPESKVPHFSL